MPHAVEMPSVLAADTGAHPAILSSHSNRPPFDLPSHLRHSYEKSNGTPRSASHTSMKNSVSDGDYSDAVGGRASGEVVNHDATPLSSSLPNGRISTNGWGDQNRPLRNDSNLSINGGMNGSIDYGRRSPGPAAPPTQNQTQTQRTRTSNGDRVSIASSTNGVVTNGRTSYDGSKVNGVAPEYFSRADVPAQVSSSNPQSTGPLTYHTSQTSASPGTTLDLPSRSATASPHRFSSPPTYAPPIVPSASSSSLPHPGLKHRHTLQVPKLGPGRGSKDGDDAIYTSGRFSPTSLAQGARRGSLSLNRRNTQSIHSNMPHEEIPPDDDAIRWAEAVRQKRASKRKRKDDEEEDRVVVGTKVDQNHVNWVTAYNMLTGIRFTVSRTNAKLDRPLTEADFDAKHKFSFDITGNELTPSAKYDFKFKDYAPWVFRHLRAKFKLDPADYLMSLTSKYILSELGSPGKSGSFFYFSRDYKYIIKTIHHGEHKFLRKILKDYYSHVEENPNTLLSQFYGLHRVKIPYGRKIHFVVMNNLFPPHRDIHQTFDLKGSTIGRDYKEEDLEQNPRATLKDLNWLRRNLNLELGPEKKRLFIEQMERDVRLLQRLKIMDYSMLVGVHDLQKGNQENLRDKTLQVFQPGGEQPEELEVGPGRLMRTPSKLENMRKAKELRQMIKQEKPVPLGHSSRMLDEMEENTAKKDFIFYSDDGGFRATHEDNSPGDEIFFLSIIDCLTHWGTLKRLENFWKGLSNDKKLLSPINPEPYGERFMKFIESITKSPEEASREKVEAEEAAAAEMMESTHSTGRRRSSSLGMHLGMNRPGAGNATLQRNDHEAAKKVEKEVDRPDPRPLGTVRSPSADRSGGLQGQILPVVEEMGEASSNGGERSIRSSQSGRPRTPPKDPGRLSVDSNEERRPRTPVKDWVGGVGASPNGMRMVGTGMSRSSLDKELPPLPPTTVNGSGKGKGKERA